MASLTVSISHAKRRVHLIADGELDGEEFRRVMREWIESAPEVFGYDRLYDLRSYSGTVTHDDVRHVGRLMRDAGADISQGLTCFVTFDRGFAFWARTMRLELPARTMQVMASMAEAEAAFAAPR